MNFAQRVGLAILLYVGNYIVISIIITIAGGFKEEPEEEKEKMLSGIRTISLLIAVGVALLV